MTPTRALIEAAEALVIEFHLYGLLCSNTATIKSLETAISSAKAAEEGVEEQVSALKSENDRLQTSNAAMRRRLADIANQYAVDCL